MALVIQCRHRGHLTVFQTAGRHRDFDAVTHGRDRLARRKGVPLDPHEVVVADVFGRPAAADEHAVIRPAVGQSP